jgi:hypothetical protein
MCPNFITTLVYYILALFTWTKYLAIMWKVPVSKSQKFLNTIFICSFPSWFCHPTSIHHSIYLLSHKKGKTISSNLQCIVITRMNSRWWLIPEKIVTKSLIIIEWWIIAKRRFNLLDKLNKLLLVKFRKFQYNIFHSNLIKKIVRFYKLGKM